MGIDVRRVSFFSAVGTELGSFCSGTGSSGNTATFVYDRGIILLGFTWWIKVFKSLKGSR